jgi:hypothetical protein
MGSNSVDSPVPLDVTTAQAKESLLIGARIIHAVNDMAPYLQGDKKVPYMFWDGEDEDEFSAALALIKRYVFFPRVVCDLCIATTCLFHKSYPRGKNKHTSL